MSTRGCVAYAEGGGWTGVYQHFDSYPEVLGHKIWEMVTKRFGGDPVAFVQEMILDHPGGWSSLGSNSYPDDEMSLIHHTDEFLEDDRRPLFIEWVYIIERENRRLSILTNAKGVSRWVWKFVGTYSFDQAEPDWMAVDAEARRVAREFSHAAG